MSLVVGLGSPHGDDQLGWVAVDRLRARLPAGIAADKVNGGVELLGVSGWARRGGRHRRRGAGGPARNDPIVHLALSQSWLTAHRWSTHGLGLVEALQLGETLGGLPALVSIYTIEAHDLSPCAELSGIVAARLDAVVESVLREVNCWHRR